MEQLTAEALEDEVNINSVLGPVLPLNAFIPSLIPYLIESYTRVSLSTTNPLYLYHSLFSSLFVHQL